MPSYCYSTDDDTTVERVFQMGRAPREVVLPNGRVATRDYRAEHSPRRAGGGWPFACYASGVNAAQAGELRKFYAEKNFDCQVTNDGDPVYRNPKHRKEALELRGFFDRDSFY